MSLNPVARESRPQVKSKHNDAGEQQSQFARIITDPGFLTVVALSLIGLLIALNLIFRFPDFGAVIAEYNQF